MDELIVSVKKKRGLKQRYHVVIRTPFDVLFWSENYANLTYAEEVARKFATLLGAELELQDFS